MEDKFYVTIDVEPDCDINWNRSNPLTFKSVLMGIPKILRPLWNKFGIKPIYFVSPEVVMDIGCCEVLKQEIKKGAVIGAHLHSEYIEPNITIKNPAGKASKEYPCFAHSTKIEFEKIKNLTNLIKKNLGVRPIWYRAARFGADIDTIKSLKKLGYKFDSSVTPGIDWRRQGGPNHSSALVQPYLISKDNYYQNADVNNGLGITEIPITIMGKRFGFLSKLFPDIWIFYRWLRPTHMTFFEMKKVIKEMKNKYKNPVFVMMFHSMEIIPNATPYVRNKFMQKIFLKKLEKVIKLMKRENEKL